MPRFISERTVILVATAVVAAAIAMATQSTLVAALPQYATATGQPCATCHVNPAGGGTLTARGQAFAAVPTHASNPSAAFAQSDPAPAPAPAPSAPAPAPAAPRAQSPAPTPAPSSPVSVTIAGAVADDSASYVIMIRNTGSQAIENVYVAGSIPAGATFGSATNTPAGSAFYSSDGGSAAWLVDSVPANGSAGPFGYKVVRSSAPDLSVAAFAHWQSPDEGTATSPVETPISAVQRLAIDQAINDKLNTSDTNLALWYLQAGTGPRMDDLLRHFNIVWFAAQAGNWGAADFEVGDQVDSTVGRIKARNTRLAPAMDAWMQDSIRPVEDAIKTQDLNQFNAAYDHAVDGCNSCHAGQTSGGVSMKVFKVVRPTTPMFSNLDYKGAP